MAEPTREAARLEDVLNYKPEEYLTPDEMTLIRSTFKDDRVMKVLRKVFLPTMSDPELPIEQLKSDLWFSGVDWAMMPVEQVKALVVARQDAIKFIMSALVKLKILASSQSVDPVEQAYQRSKDSAQ